MSLGSHQAKFAHDGDRDEDEEGSKAKAEKKEETNTDAKYMVEENKNIKYNKILRQIMGPTNLTHPLNFDEDALYK